MPLIVRLPGSHSIQRFRLAARQRFEEAKRSAMTGDRLIGIYLCGYAAEMTLKAAYFRFDGRKSTDPITLADLHAARGYAIKTLGIGWANGNLHDLTRWAELLVEARRARNSPYPPAFGNDLILQVNRVHGNWREFLRYHTNRPRREEVDVTFRAVAWLIANDTRL